MTLQYPILFVARLYYKHQKYTNDIKALMSQSIISLLKALMSQSLISLFNLSARFLSITFVSATAIKIVQSSISSNLTIQRKFPNTEKDATP